MFSQVSTLRTHCWLQREGGGRGGGVSEQALLGLPGVACEQALHLGDIVKSRRARGTPKLESLFAGYQIACPIYFSMTIHSSKSPPYQQSLSRFIACVANTLNFLFRG